MDNIGKLHICANIELASDDMSAINSALGIPDKDNRQPDLQYITSIFVSTGMNLNGAYFMPHELIKARNTITSKPLDIEHDEERVVGHLFSRAFLDKEGKVMDMEEMTLSHPDTDSMSFDIATGMYVYKARFPGVAQDVLDGKYAVSMECYYRDFDIIVGDVIVPRVEAEKIGLLSKINKMVKVVDKGNEVGTFKVGRVLRDILFSGCGLVENPANPDSIILEAAAVDDYVLDLGEVKERSKAKDTKVFDMSTNDNSLVDKAAFFSHQGGAHKHIVEAGEKYTVVGGNHVHFVLAEDLPVGVSLYIEDSGEHKHVFSPDTGVFDEEKEHVHAIVITYVDENDPSKVKTLFSETSPPITPHTHSVGTVYTDTPAVTGDGVTGTGDEIGNYIQTFYGGVHKHTIKISKDLEVTTVTMNDMLSTFVDGEGKAEKAAEAITTSDTCVSFRRFVYKTVSEEPHTMPNDPTPGMVDQVDSVPIPSGGGGEGLVGPNSQVIHENWCTLFDTACTSSGGIASHPDCLRVILNRTTKEVISSYADKIAENRSKIPAIDSLRSLIQEAKKIIDK